MKYEKKKADKNFFVDETGVNLLISVSLKINTERQVKGKFGHLVQSDVCREP